MKFLWAIRRQRGMSQLQLATLAGHGTSQTLISLAERGALTFRPDQLDALARVLGVNAADLLKDVAPAPDSDTEAVSHAS